MENRTERKPYETDLSDAEWAIIEPLIPGGKPGGRPRETNIREVINAISQSGHPVKARDSPRRKNLGSGN
jgi:transposase